MNDQFDYFCHKFNKFNIGVNYFPKMPYQEYLKQLIMNDDSKSQEINDLINSNDSFCSIVSFLRLELILPLLIMIYFIIAWFFGIFNLFKPIWFYFYSYSKWNKLSKYLNSSLIICIICVAIAISVNLSFWQEAINVIDDAFCMQLQTSIDYKEGVVKSWKGSEAHIKLINDLDIKLWNVKYIDFGEITSKDNVSSIFSNINNILTNLNDKVSKTYFKLKDPETNTVNDKYLPNILKVSL